MKYIQKNSKLPIPEVLAYDASLLNEIKAPFTVISFLQGKSVSILWNDPDVEKPVLEARRQKLLHSLADIMCTLSTTTFPRAGTLWFPEEHGPPVVGDSYRLDKDDIFAIKHEFLTFPPKDSVADLLRAGQFKRLKEDEFPQRHRSATDIGVYMLWNLMIGAFLQSGGKMEAGEPEFVLMQSDFVREILSDDLLRP